MWSSLLYISHVLLELALGLIKLRGRYAHEVPGSKSARNEMYCRHHGCSLLSLALLGYFVWQHDLVDTSTGAAASTVLAVFHGGAVASFTYAYSLNAIPVGKVIVPHLPFALGFAAHAWQAG